MQLLEVPLVAPHTKHIHFIESLSFVLEADLLLNITSPYNVTRIHWTLSEITDCVERL